MTDSTGTREGAQRDRQEKIMKRMAWALVFAMVAAGCTDKAKPSLDDCVKAEAKEDWSSAVRSCEQATTLDPDSKSGKAAADKLTSLKAKLAAKDNADADAKAAARARLAAEERTLASKVRFVVVEASEWDQLGHVNEPCTKRAKPPGFARCERSNKDVPWSDEQKKIEMSACQRLADLRACVRTYENPESEMYCCS